MRLKRGIQSNWCVCERHPPWRIFKSNARMDPTNNGRNARQKTVWGKIKCTKSDGWNIRRSKNRKNREKRIKRQNRRHQLNGGKSSQTNADNRNVNKKVNVCVVDRGTIIDIPQRHFIYLSSKTMIKMTAQNNKDITHTERE